MQLDSDKLVLQSQMNLPASKINGLTDGLDVFERV